MNVGVVLYCKKLNFLQAIITVNEARICCFTNEDEAQQILASSGAATREAI